MAFASGSFHGLQYIEEVTFGTTPLTPEMTSLRHTGAGLVLSKNSFQSAELRSDRQISDLRHGTKQVGGPIDVEMSYGEFDAFLEAALFGTWATDVLKAGTTEKFFTIERLFSDIAQYGVFTGCMVNSFSMNVVPDGIVTATFDVVGKGASYSGTPLDATPTASQANSPFDSFSGVLKEGGVTIGVVTGFDMTLDNGLAAQFVVGSDETPAITNGRSNLTGNVTAFFENATLLNKFINETESSLEFTLGDGVSNSYTILIPRLKYSGGDNTVTDEGPVTISMPFQALLDGVTGTNIQITRIP